MALRSLLLSFLLSSFGLSAQEPPAEKAATIKENLTLLELELEEVQGAKYYELEFTAKSGKKQSYQITSPQFAQKMPSGEYGLRIRSVTDEGPGEWSESLDIRVLPVAVKLLEPPKDGVVPGSGKKTKVFFKWQAAQGAKKYRLRVWSEKKVKVHEFVTSKTERSLRLKPGRVYIWEVRATGQRGEEYEMPGEVFRFQLLGGALPPPVIGEIPNSKVKKIPWAPVKKAHFYQGKLFRRDIEGEEWVEVATLEKQEKLEWSFKKALKPGEYKVSVSALSKTHAGSPPAEKTFFVKPTLKDLAGI